VPKFFYVNLIHIIASSEEGKAQNPLHWFRALYRFGGREGISICDLKGGWGRTPPS